METVEQATRTVRSATAAERIPGVEYDADGKPIWYTGEETFDHIDARIIERYGNGVCDELNAIRVKYGLRPLPAAEYA
jgi:hypothetical protein